MNPKAIHNLFARRNPTWRILPKIEPLAERVTINIERRHAKNALRDDRCECTNAHAARDRKGVIDAAVGLTYAHFLMDAGGGRARIVKAQLSPGARSVVEANDAGLPVWGMSLDFVPPVPSRNPGVQTQAQKAALPGKRKLSPEHVAAIQASRKRSAGRRLLSNASVD